MYSFLVGFVLCYIIMFGLSCTALCARDIKNKSLKNLCKVANRRFREPNRSDGSFSATTNIKGKILQGVTELIFNVARLPFKIQFFTSTSSVVENGN